MERSEHGKMTFNKTNAGSGSIVTLTVAPDSGYVLDTHEATGSSPIVSTKEPLELQRF